MKFDIYNYEKIKRTIYSKHNIIILPKYRTKVPIIGPKNKPFDLPENRNIIFELSN